MWGKFLTFYLGHGSTEIDVQYMSVGCHQCRDGFHPCIFGLGDAGFVFADMDDLDIGRSDKADDVLFCTYADRTAGMIKNGFAHDSRN